MRRAARAVCPRCPLVVPCLHNRPDCGWAGVFESQEKLRDAGDNSARSLASSRQRNRKLHRENQSLREKIELLESCLVKQSEREIKREQRREAIVRRERSRIVAALTIDRTSMEASFGGWG